MTAQYSKIARDGKGRYRIGRPSLERRSLLLIELRVTEIAPGVRLHVSPDRRWKTTAISARAAAPLDEATSETALVPFLLSRGTQRTPTARGLAARLEELFDAELECDVLRLGDAQVVEARIDVAGRAYVRASGRDPLAEAIGLLGEVLFRPALDAAALFPEGTFALERENLVHDVEGLKDERSDYAIERTHRLLGRGEPSARHELGDVDSAESLTRDAVTARWRVLMHERALDVLVAGDVDPLEVLALVRRSFPLDERRFDAKAASRVMLAAPRSPGHRKPARETERLEGRQAHVCVGFRGGAGYLSPGYGALLIANAVLGAAQTARLFMNVRERDGLAYEAYTVLDRAKGNIVAHFGVDPANVARVETAARDEVARLSRNPPSDVEVADARKEVLQRILDIEDDAQMRLGFAYARALAGRLDITANGLQESVRAVTAEDVRAATAALVHDATVVIAPA
jgi:predicted Zn-dependent peptidase